MPDRFDRDLPVPAHFLDNRRQVGGSVGGDSRKSGRNRPVGASAVSSSSRSPPSWPRTADSHVPYMMSRLGSWRTRKLATNSVTGEWANRTRAKSVFASTISIIKHPSPGMREARSADGPRAGRDRPDSATPVLLGRRDGDRRCGENATIKPRPNRWRLRLERVSICLQPWVPWIRLRENRIQAIETGTAGGTMSARMGGGGHARREGL